ncbi:MAG: methyltransferase domain-containing protein [Candidatus Omnitrophica bacterium]|nr:methyltransferase domain-containing protein [Candidatus Omnitrophota bacterium]
MNAARAHNSTPDYIHGYSEGESNRLTDQANTLAEYLHHDTVYAQGEHVLEIGCGVGAQTVILARNHPQTCFTSIDISFPSLILARERIHSCGCTNVSFQQADIFNLPFSTETFDHVFLCFVLEHLRDPVLALQHIQRILKKSGSMTVIEGDHGSAIFHPFSSKAQQTIQCLVNRQAQSGGNALIGRALYPLLQQAQYKNINVSPRQIYTDASCPDLVDSFTKKTFIAMVETVKPQVLANQEMDPYEWQQGIEDLYRTTTLSGSFAYTFFKATALK